MNEAAARPVAVPGIEAIVVGASAGGVEALLSIYSGLPQGFRLPIITVLHLPEEPRSQLAEVFARRVSMPVVEARDKAGALFGFERTGRLSVEPAEAIARTAQAFGQDDDITALTLARIA